MLAQLLSYAGIGALAGFFAGLLGVGGGAIVGPMLIFVYIGVLGFSADYAAHMAVATASAVIVFTAPVSAATHARRRNVNWRLAGLVSGGAVCGAFAGAHSAAQAPASLLKILLLVFLLANTASMLLPRRRRAAAAAAADALPPVPRLSVGEMLPVSFGIGGLSAVLGIGGGALTIPYLHRRGVFIRHAIGTSAFIGFPLALAAAAGYVWAGRDVQGLPPASWGYVYLPALAGIAFFSIVSAWAGARLSHKLPAEVLRRVFALMTALIALRLLWTLLEGA